MDHQDDDGYPKSAHWQIDRRVPLALIYTFATGFLMTATAGGTAVGILYNKVDGIQAEMNRRAGVLERMAALESNVVAIKTSVGRIEDRLDSVDHPR